MLFFLQRFVEKGIRSVHLPQKISKSRLFFIFFLLIKLPWSTSMQKTPPNCKVGLGEIFLVVCNHQAAKENDKMTRKIASIHVHTADLIKLTKMNLLFFISLFLLLRDKGQRQNIYTTCAFIIYDNILPT